MNELSGVKILKSGNRQPKKGKCLLKAVTLSLEG